ncbi:NAD(P)/FAD-dependent oxidoreductase [Streptomyces sp. TRM 70351]|uniref:flavin-containing monooxygenase n=1 Tax=Streptomyces sp. TRM 70351 TaxID=3116552 RepID=UPI002E7B1F5C|nr:NAD(P)/FAD-dependent oxidoreductase [Streptomyces sp. TRM 70351]MEE1929690.1 NAD(P)/FAD-dependent oxidoreductase [Streptomyces sp. TRM 70351]
MTRSGEPSEQAGGTAGSGRGAGLPAGLPAGEDGGPGHAGAGHADVEDPAAGSSGAGPAGAGRPDPEHLDVVIVGAGLSGVGAGYRVQSECPGKSYAILESRDAIGGTWDLFRYPGVRSDSDMYTLGYPFRPWRDDTSLADGDVILRYIRDTAREYGIDRRIRYRTKVVAADWSSRHARWTLTCDVRDPDGTTRTSVLTCSFLYTCAGYYDYRAGHAPAFPGTDDFAGTLVHPQFWPGDLDYTGRRVVVVGSGATAVTLVPALARRASHVTMLQRSPTWISPLPSRDRVAAAVRRVLPPGAAHSVVRTKNILFTLGFYQFCRRSPRAARKLLTGLAARTLGDRQTVEDHFTPAYDPWDQRLCAIPDADLFRVLRSGRADVVTDRVDTFVPEGIRLASGKVLEADVVVTATGLSLLAFGGMELAVDGQPFDVAQSWIYRGAMLSGLPNFAACVGYSNASWTLRADLSSRLVCKVINHLDRNGYAAAVPRPDAGMVQRPLLDLSSGYIQRSIARFPKQGSRRPWTVPQNYLVDAATTLRGDLGEHLELLPPPPPAAVPRARTGG